MPEPRCEAFHTVPSVRGAIDPRTGSVLQVRVYCQGLQDHTGPHFNGHDAKGNIAGTWED